ncbi:RhoGAP-domain-containing protein [Athelia psychrophila]|uniref:RhoGAP-domain-containing protein n=1 Tax=Athelia psychrophila TaxID=1759441 RepID=A0A166IHE7_9AGAM|nr:RhoGAP-domain-containing protein [Fibularhizoctonia sp. CBS 109695]
MATMSLKSNNSYDASESLLDAYSHADDEGVEDRLCPGCKLSAVNENGGLVVAFGQSFFHVDCFKCAKCGDQVTADTNLLLLSDGSPICANCSYSCNVCNLPILDEAIMTGDDSYHAHCFKCKVCKTRIDELVFAKTSQGIYCMNCHNERMAKIRRHAQKKKERERAGSSTKSKSRERGGTAGEFGALSPGVDASFTADASFRSNTSTTPSREFTRQNSHPHINESLAARPSSKQSSLPLVSDAFKPVKPLMPASISITPETPPRNQRPSNVEVNVAIPNGDYSSASSPSFSRATSATTEPSSSTSTQQEFLKPNGAASALQRKKSYDDGTRPLGVLYRQKGAPEALNLAVTSKSDKRRSIQPLARPLTNSPPNALSPSSPRSPSFAQTLSPAPYSRADSPHNPSPSPTRRAFTTSPPPASPHPGSARNSASTVFHSPTGSPLPPEKDLDYDERRRPSSAAPGSSFGDANGDGRPPMRPSVTLDEVPRANSPHTRDRERVRLSSESSTLGQQKRLSPLGGLNGNGHSLRMQKSFDDGARASSPLSPSGGPVSAGSWPASGSRSRPNSGSSRRADVPHSVESGTDTDGERDSAEAERGSGKVPTSPGPVPPPKETPNGRSFAKESASHAKESSPKDHKDDTVEASMMLRRDSTDSADDYDELESPPVQSTSIATFIAPALPPIRFSMTGGDFAEMMKGVGNGMPSWKSQDHMLKLAEELDSTPSTPPPSAMPVTPGSDVTVTDVGDETIKFSIADAARDAAAQRMAASSDPQERAAAAPRVFEGMPSESSSAQRPRTADSHRPTPIAVLAPTRPSTGSADSPTKGLAPDSAARSNTTATDSSDLVVTRLREAYADATQRGAQQLKLDKGFVEAILGAFDQRQGAFKVLKGKHDGMTRASQHYAEGMNGAQTEYDSQLKARRDAEAEVTRLRVLLSGQAVRLSAISGETKKQEQREEMSRELSSNLDDLERKLSKLKVERDMTMAEVEELSASKISSPGEVPGVGLARSLTMRLDNIKSQYQHELLPLTQQREALAREIADLKTARDMFLEETTVLNARNEELAQLSAQYARRMETMTGSESHPIFKSEVHAPPMERKSSSFDKSRVYPSAPGLQSSFSASSASTTTLAETHGSLGRNNKILPEISSPMSRPGKFKWPGSKAKEAAAGKGPKRQEHKFQQHSVLRFTRCDHCGDKMWGSQLRCTCCNISVHVRCISHVQAACVGTTSGRPENQNHSGPLPPSMFGRDLGEQIKSDARYGDRQVPVIVEKCIDAVEALALDYEGVYRKNGGSGQSKVITQLFERGDYEAFDLRDQEQFNDISSVTSVLKTYFRSLPTPLLTYDLHDEFMTAAAVKEPEAKYDALLEAVNKLPNEYYYTLRLLMLHLNNIREHSEINLMTARNLGVVFGPTLMRSKDPAVEFSDMAGKAITVEWLVDNAPAIFPPPPSH